MMKKLLALLLTLVLCFALLACKEEPEDPETPGNDPDSGVIIPPETDDDGGIDLPIIPA